MYELPYAFYGTLMDLYDDLDPFGSYGAPCVIPGQIWSVNDMFPALTPSEDQVVGQIFQPHPGLEDLCARIFDHIEGFDGTPESLYRREVVELLEPEGVRA